MGNVQFGCFCTFQKQNVHKLHVFKISMYILSNLRRTYLNELSGSYRANAFNHLVFKFYKETCKRKSLSLQTVNDTTLIEIKTHVNTVLD